MDGLGDVPDLNAPGLDMIQAEGGVSAMIRLVNENPGQVCVSVEVHLGGVGVYVSVGGIWLVDECVYMCVRKNLQNDILGLGD